MKEVSSENYSEHQQLNQLNAEAPSRKRRMRFSRVFGECIQRCMMPLKVITISFLSILFISMLLTALTLIWAPWLSEFFWSLAQPGNGYVNIPAPYTENLYYFILKNNISHFWNPLKMIVWIPLIGTFVLGLELMLNAAMIGIVAILAGMTYGVLFPIVGLVPHGVIEIPAFIIQFAALIRWHVTIIDSVITKITQNKTNYSKLKQRIKDTVILAIVSVTLFVIAAFIETYITPRLLRL